MNRFRVFLREAAAPGCVVAALVAIAVLGMLPPTTVAADGDPTGFSAERAFEHVEAIAGEPRPMGSAGSAAARDYLMRQIESLGLEPVLQTMIVPDYYAPTGDVEVVNVMARIEGTYPTGAIVLIGHYDTYPSAPGANDNATAVATVLETGRALMEGPPIRNDVILLLTDGEEPAPRYGSTAFVERHAFAEDVRLAINFEAIGGHGPSQLIEIAGNEGALIAHYAEAVPRPVASSVLDDVVELIGGSNTDIAPFRDRGIAGFEFAYWHGSPIYHTPDDDIDSVHLGSLQHHGSHAVALARRFGDLDLAQLDGTGQEVFFTLFGRVVVHYPAAIGILLGLAAGLMLALALWVEARSKRAGLGKVAAGAGWLLLIALGVGLVLAIVWRLLVEVLWDSSGPMGAAATAWMLALLAIAIATTAPLYRRLAARSGEETAEWAGVTLLWVLGMASSLALPGTAYLFIWPVFAALLVASRRTRARWARIGGFAAVSAPAIVLVLPVLDLFFQFGQPRPGNLDSQVPEMMLMVGLLASLMTMLLIPHLRRTRV